MWLYYNVRLGSLTETVASPTALPRITEAGNQAIRLEAPFENTAQKFLCRSDFRDLFWHIRHIMTKTNTTMKFVLSFSILYVIESFYPSSLCAIPFLLFTQI